jgi:epoxyqueuosine reductase QueG
MGEAIDERCGGCEECVEVCPPRAFTGRPFRVEEPREARFAARKCDEYLDEMGEATGVSVCGLCLYACPYGRTEGAAKPKV